MKTTKIKLLSLVLLSATFFAACSKEEATTTTTPPTTTTTDTTNSFSVKIDGTLSDFKKVQVGRSTFGGEELILIKANKAATGADTAKVFNIVIAKPSFGWEDETDFDIDNNEIFASINYTDGVKFYGTANQPKGAISKLYITKVEYKVGGKLTGTFSGKLYTTDSSTVNLTEGKFDLKAAN